MNDLISRQAAIEAVAEGLKRTFVEYRDVAEKMLNKVPSAQPDNQINLCDSCDYSYPDCPSKNGDVIFGNNIGNDNICACNKYKPSAQPEQRWIPVTKKLPEEMAVVLVYTSVDGYFTAYFDGICWYHAGLHMMRIYSDVVAWTPLPEPYKTESKG